MGSHDATSDENARRKALSRRSFITRGSVAVAAAGVVASNPGLASALSIGGSEAPAADSAIADAAAGTMTEPLVAHVRDLASGEISVYSGTQEVVFRDPGLAHRLFNARR